uniref:Uncharacterized protein n=1 Tax=Heliothis virescens TaxID=7102 RepID=A0A2A4K379_HELVI
MRTAAMTFTRRCYSFSVSMCNIEGIFQKGYLVSGAEVIRKSCTSSHWPVRRRNTRRIADADATWTLCGHTRAQRGLSAGTAWAQRGRCAGTARAQRGHSAGTALAQHGHSAGSARAQRGHSAGTARALRRALAAACSHSHAPLTTQKPEHCAARARNAPIAHRPRLRMRSHLIVFTSQNSAFVN